VVASPWRHSGQLLLEGEVHTETLTLEPTAVTRLTLGVNDVDDDARLVVVSGMQLGGILEINYDEEFFHDSLGVGDRYLIASAATYSGEFEHWIMSPSQYEWDLRVEGNLLLLEVVSAPMLPGDFDSDGDVDGVDFLRWQRTDGTAAGLTDWQTDYGAPSSAAAAATSVPEPSSLLLLLTSCLFAAYSGRCGNGLGDDRRLKCL
jgi:hypothetical protein